MTADDAGWQVADLGDAVGAFDDFFTAELLPRFPGAQLRRRSDAARLDASGVPLAATCDAFTVEPLVFPGGDIGKLAICGTANDLLSEAARPQWLLLSVVASAGLDRAVLRKVLDSVERQARESGAEVVGGDLKTLPGPAPQLVLTVTGLGQPRRTGAPLDLASARPGDELVVTGDVGRHVIAVISAREGLGFERVVTSDCADLGLSLLPLVAESAEVRGLRDATRGGLAGVLHELTAACGLDVQIQLDAVPVERPVAMACELLGMDPLDLANEGCAVLLARAGAGEALARTLRAECGFGAAAVFGVVQERADAREPRVLVADGESVRVQQRRSALGLPRLC